MDTVKKLGLTPLEAVEIIEPMNTLLANYAVHQQKLKAFHWNVKGQDFFELHQLFEELYIEANNNIDVLAERIRVFGQYPISTMHQYLSISEIKEVRKEYTSFLMVQEITNDFEILFSFIFNVIAAADKNGDASTRLIMTRILEKVEKHHWQLSAWMTNEV